MEIKAKLNKPYSDKQRADFIVENNHNKGYEIKETLNSLEAWGLTDEEQAQKELDDKKSSVREVRNQYLADTDLYMIADFPITEEERDEYKAYRQYLRDYTTQDNWWEENPLTYEDWQNAMQFALAEE